MNISSRLTIFSAAILLGFFGYQQPSRSQTGNPRFDSLIQNYKKDTERQRRDQNLYEVCVAQSGGSTRSCSQPSFRPPISAFYLGQIHQYLQAVGQKALQDPRWCPKAASYHRAAFHADQERPIGEGPGAAMQAYCLKRGYSLPFS